MIILFMLINIESNQAQRQYSSPNHVEHHSRSFRRTIRSGLSPERRFPGDHRSRNGHPADSLRILENGQ